MPPYNNADAVPDSQERIAPWRERSAAVRAGAGARLDIPYGSRPRARFDCFSSGTTGAPPFVLIHGGYWQRNDKDMFAVVADGPRALAAGVARRGYPA
jgi:arylformamidase